MAFLCIDLTHDEAHEPSADLVDAIRQYENMLQHEQDAMQANGAAMKAEPGVVNNHVKPEPDAEGVYDISRCC